MAAAESSKAAAKKSLAQATTEEELRDARKSLINAQASLAAGKLQKALGNPDDLRQGAVYGISVIDKLLDPKRRADVEQILGGVGRKPGGFSLGAFEPDWSLNDRQLSAVADIDQLGGRMFLEMAQKMRGLGQLTEGEGKKIVAAAGNLTRRQSPDRFFATLGEMRSALAEAAKRKPGSVPAGTLDIGGEPTQQGAQSGAQPAAPQPGGAIDVGGGFMYTPGGD